MTHNGKRAGWQKVTIDEIADAVTVGIASAATHAYVASGVALLRNLNIKAGYLDDSDLLFITPEFDKKHHRKRLQEGDILTVRSGAPGLSAVVPARFEGAQCFTCLVTRPKHDLVISEFLCTVINSEIGVRFFGIGEAGGAQKNVNAGTLKEFTFDLPPLVEQASIVAWLNLYDRAWAKLGKLHVAKRLVLRGLMQQLLTGRRRLPSFAAQLWNQARLRSVTSECTKRNGAALGVTRVMAVNKTHGLIPMRERTIANDLNRYKVVSPGAFAYNPMRLNIGSIARSHFDHDVLVSPDYVVFECTECEPRYLDALRRSGLWRRHMAIAGNGSVRVRIYYDDLASMKVRMPGLAEQRAIADVLDTAQKEVDLLKHLRDQIQKQKRGLMQKLLTGQIQVPAARNKPARSKP